MSCEKCDKIQESIYDENRQIDEFLVYVRVGTGNIQIFGCEEHIKQLIRNLRSTTCWVRNLRSTTCWVTVIKPD